LDILKERANEDFIESVALIYENGHEAQREIKRSIFAWSYCKKLFLVLKVYNTIALEM
tara:strand:- start:4185 stop:4358 length:174 start_codon:yes stop_codon:yes gene_type:complete